MSAARMTDEQTAAFAQMEAEAERLDPGHLARASAEQAAEIERLKGENERLVSWLADVTEILTGERPVGVMPETTKAAAIRLRLDRSRLGSVQQEASANLERAEKAEVRLGNVLERLAEEVGHFSVKPCAAHFMAVLSGIEAVARRARNEGLEKAAHRFDRTGHFWVSQIIRELKEAEQ